MAAFRKYKANLLWVHMQGTLENGVRPHTWHACHVRGLPCPALPSTSCVCTTRIHYIHAHAINCTSSTHHSSLHSPHMHAITLTLVTHTSLFTTHITPTSHTLLVTHITHYITHSSNIHAMTRSSVPMSGAGMSVHGPSTSFMPCLFCLVEGCCVVVGDRSGNRLVCCGSAVLRCWQQRGQTCVLAGVC